MVRIYSKRALFAVLHLMKTCVENQIYGTLRTFQEIMGQL
jgi:hypothetical protein